MSEIKKRASRPDPNKYRKRRSKNKKFKQMEQIDDK